MIRMNQERQSDGPYTVADSGCLVFRNGRGVSNFDSRRDAMNAASLANMSYAAGRKAERERCAGIARQHFSCEGIAQEIEKEIMGGQDAE